MNELFAQGDLLIERIDDGPISGIEIEVGEDGAVVLAEGEATGHRHAIFDCVTMFRDDGLARDIPAGLYVGHIQVRAERASISHEEHAAIVLTKGTWRVRQQRQFEPLDIALVQD